MEALGHNSTAVHRAYAKNAQVLLPALEVYEQEAMKATMIGWTLTTPSAAGRRFRRWQRGPTEGGVATDIGTGDNADVQRTPWAKGAVGQAVNHLERLYYGRGGTALSPLRSHTILALTIALASAIDRGQRTCLLSETLSPDQAALHMVCLRARTPLERVVSQELQQADFARLIDVVGKLSALPLALAALPSDGGEKALDDLWVLTREYGVKVVVVEAQGIKHLASLRSALESFVSMRDSELYLVAACSAGGGRSLGTDRYERT